MIGEIPFVGERDVTTEGVIEGDRITRVVITVLYWLLCELGIRSFTEVEE